MLFKCCKFSFVVNKHARKLCERGFILIGLSSDNEGNLGSEAVKHLLDIKRASIKRSLLFFIYFILLMQSYLSP